MNKSRCPRCGHIHIGKLTGVSKCLNCGSRVDWDRKELAACVDPLIDCPLTIAAYKEKVRELQAKVDSQADTIGALRGWKKRWEEEREGLRARNAELEREKITQYVLASTLAPSPHITPDEFDEARYNPDNSPAPRPWWKVWG